MHLTGKVWERECCSSWQSEDNTFSAQNAKEVDVEGATATKGALAFIQAHDSQSRRCTVGWTPP